MKLPETSCLVDYEQGVESARRFNDEHRHGSLAASTVSMFELAFRVVSFSTRDLEDLVTSLAWVEFLPFTVDDALEAARIHAELEGMGERIPIADAVIAGAARNRGADLVARDAHVDDSRGLSVTQYRQSRSGPVGIDDRIADP